MEEEPLKHDEIKPERDEPKPADAQQPIGANDKHYALYNLVDLHGGGELIPWMRYALKSDDFSLIDGYMETTVQQMMFNSGKGRLESVAELVKRRNKERNERLSAFSRKKGKGKSEPNILDDFNQEGNQGDLKKALKLLDGGKGGKGESKYREIVWKYEDRGSMGENLVGCCLMQGSAVHCRLAARLIEKFPGLVNDIFLSEDYYGLSPLHLAIVNEDPAMVAWLLNKGADVNQRCYGALFYPDDQVSTRTDSLEHEYVEINYATDYVGKLYFGEYPLAFCVCTEQPDCYRILMKHRGTNPNAQDTNGNTVLHMAVIHQNPEMFKLAYENGAKLQVMNKQKLTPLTLAAKLAKKGMFEHILRLESTDLWSYGLAASTEYPLAKIDTINQETGELNEDSALSLVTYGGTEQHLELLDGLLEDLLQAKWDAFGKKRWTRSLIAFSVYYVFYFMAFMCRPFSATTSVIAGRVITTNGELTTNVTPIVSPLANGTTPTNTSSQAFQFFYSHETCHLWQYFNYGYQGYVRLLAECVILVMIGVNMFFIANEVYHVGRKRWWQVLKSFPAKIMYKISMILTLMVVLSRMGCGFGETFLLLDNLFSVVGVILTATYFLYFFRAVPFVGSFVLMIYRIVTRDISRFLFIYLIFITGFSQSYYIIFQACERINMVTMGKEAAVEFNLVANPFESFLRLFIATVGEDKEFYYRLNLCKAKSHKVIGEFLFVVYQLFVSLMQLNLLIAAMQRTYELIYRSDREPKRQWAQVILMIELALKPHERLEALIKYSRPIGIDKRKRAFVVTRKKTQLSETEKQIHDEQENEKAEAKKQLLKKRLREFQKEVTVKRPTTSAPSMFSRLSVKQKTA